MEIVSVTRTEQQVIARNVGMSQYLKNLQSGRPSTPRSWLFEKLEPHVILKTWIPIMKSVNNTTSYGDIMNQFDLQQVVKFGPQGQVPPFWSAQVKEVLDPIFERSKFDTPSQLHYLYDEAHKFGKLLFKHVFSRLRPMSAENVLLDLRERDSLSTNSGYPYFTVRSKASSADVVHAKTGEAFAFPAILLFRQYSGKLRPVWMFPLSCNIVESTFSRPIMHAVQTCPEVWINNFVCPWKGFDAVKATLTSQVGLSYQHLRHDYCIISGDTTKMDAHMRKAQLNLCFEIVKWAFQKQYWADLHKSLIHVADIPLLISVNQKIVGEHGLASGSAWTNLSETILQLFLAYLLKVHGQGIGDDFIWFSNMNSRQVVSALSELGFPANPLKQTISNDHCTFLQRLFVRGFANDKTPGILAGYYPTIRALNSLIYPEKYHSPKVWNSDLFCCRTFMICENCVDNPCFEQFIKFVVRGQKDLIPFSQKSRAKLDAIMTYARRVPGLSPTYNQEKRDKPLSTFESIKLASRL